jgi:signal transduction histidine kinase
MAHARMMRHLSITRKLVLGKAAMLAVTFVTVGVIVRGVYVTNEVVGQLTGRHETLTSASYELEINAAETAADAGKYLVTGDHRFRDAFAKDNAAFLASMAQFDRVADPMQLQEDVARLRAEFGDLTAVARRLMDGRDEQVGLLETTADDVDRFNGLLRALDASIVNGRSSTERRVQMLTLEARWAEATAWLGNGLRTPMWTGKNRFDGYLHEGERLLHDLARSATTAHQARLVAALRHRGDTLRDHLQAAAGLIVRLNNDQRQFVALRGAIDDTLDHRIQPAVDAERRALQQTATRAIRRATLLAALLAPILLVVGLASTAWVVISLRRPMAALTAGVSALGRGDLDHRVHVPAIGEFAKLAAALNWMAAHIQKSQSELRALSARIVSLREAERKAIAREIHDDLGQTLTAMKIGLSRLDGRCGRVPADECARVLALQHELTGLADSAISTMRRVASGLRPSVLDHLGLGAAIEWQVAEFGRQTGIVCDLDAVDIEPPIDDERAIACFRVVQEALTNVARHSGATRASVRVEAQPETLVFEIADNGKGIADERLSGVGSLGLLGMRERVQSFGGRMTMARVETGGTRVRVEISRQPLAVAACGPECVPANACLGCPHNTFACRAA